jgi:hypothetical protein
VGKTSPEKTGYKLSNNDSRRRQLHVFLPHRLSEGTGFPGNRQFLSSQPKRLYDGAIPFDILTFYIIQKSAAPAYQNEQSSSGMMILFVDFQMIGQV